MKNFLKHNCIVDVRSPCEFQKGHIPGAINIPLFSNEERSIVGTIYKQIGRREAVKKGLEIIDLKRISDALFLLPSKIGIYCFRGGMRSASVAYIAQLLGCEVEALKGGYKAFRSWAIERFKIPYTLAILGGKTGSGKTVIINKMGENAIDLEKLASHRGSVFGGLGRQQPTQEQFENELAAQLFWKAGKNPLWLEDESRYIGTIKIPDALFLQMQNANTYILEKSFEERLATSIKEYSIYTTDKLKDAVLRLIKKLGSQKCLEVVNAIDCGDLTKAASILLQYYDKKYEYGLSKKRKPKLIFNEILNS